MKTLFIKNRFGRIVEVEDKVARKMVKRDEGDILLPHEVEEMKQEKKEAKTSKSLNTLNKAKLLELAKELKIEIKDETITRDALVEKIEEARK